MVDKALVPSLRDLGYRVLKTDVPHLPDTIFGAPTEMVEKTRFQPHPEAAKLAKIYQTRLATQMICDPVDGEAVEISLVEKNHPYLGATPYDTMVQYFGKREVRTPAEWRDEQFGVGLEYFSMVRMVMEAMIELIDESALFLSSTNCAPFSKYSAPYNVQSVSAPHTHNIAFTQRELDHWTFLEEFSSSAERRKYTGLNFGMSRLYRQIVAELLPEYAVDERETPINDIGKGFISPVRLTEAQMLLHKRSDIQLPPGFTFSLKNGISDIATPEFLNRLIVFDEALGRIYMDLAAIFIRNYNDIPDIGYNPEESVPLWLRSHNSLEVQYKAYVDKLNGTGIQRLSEDSVRGIGRILRLLSSGSEGENGQLIKNIMTRGPAYSIILTPEQMDNPEGSWRVSLPLWIFGGGGVEGMGIEKRRVNPKEPGHNELIQRYLAVEPERRQFKRQIVQKLVDANGSIQSCLV